MTAHADHVLTEAMALAPDERSLVAIALLDSLQGDGTPEDEVTRSWVAEARRRSDEIKAGRVAAVPLEEFRAWFNSL
ncbi:MAG TPA: addiction module protein [Ideonella sp.]|nr:addiction module protein [Ideonella sp.]